MRFSRERSCSVEIPGKTRCNSTKRRGPAARSRMISSVHLSPTRSRARASGAHWSYGWRLGGGTGGKGTPPGHASLEGPRWRENSRSRGAQFDFLDIRRMEAEAETAEESSASFLRRQRLEGTNRTQASVGSEIKGRIRWAT